MSVAIFWLMLSLATASLVWAVVEHRRRMDAEDRLRRRRRIDRVIDNA